MIISIIGMLIGALVAGVGCNRPAWIPLRLPKR